MVKIVQKNNYFYFQYSFKENSKSKTIETYIGKKIPKYIMTLQEEFEEYVFNRRFNQKIVRTN